jgi:hypothetical protein
VLRQQVRELPRQRRNRTRARALTSAAAAAALLALGGGAWKIGQPGADLAQAGQPALELRELAGMVLLEGTTGKRRLERGAELALPLEGQLRVEPGGSAELRTDGGVSLALAESSVVLLNELGNASQKRLRLLAGEVTCQVPRLAQNESFAVVTPSARVVVHGTVFRVRVNDATARDGTCVEVTEGAVIVHHDSGQIALNSGESWGCGAKPRSAERAASRSDRSQLERAPLRESADARRSSAGTLEPEVRLLQAALVAERNGDKAAAERALSLLLRRYPQSPLSTEARGALSRIRGLR